MIKTVVDNFAMFVTANVGAATTKELLVSLSVLEKTSNVTAIVLVIN